MSVALVHFDGVPDGTVLCTTVDRAVHIVFAPPSEFCSVVTKDFLSNTMKNVPIERVQELSGPCATDDELDFDEKFHNSISEFKSMLKERIDNSMTCVVVAHHLVIRSLMCSFTSVPPDTPSLFRLTTCSELLPGDTWKPPPSAPRGSGIRLLPIPRVLFVLGCSIPQCQLPRLRHAKARVKQGLNQLDARILLVGRWPEVKNFRQAIMRDSWTEKECKSVAYLDLNSSFTTCNAHFAKVLLAEHFPVSTEVEVITNDWHICRSLATFFASGLISAIPSWSITTKEEIEGYEKAFDLRYLREQAIHTLNSTTRFPQYWGKAEELCFEANILLGQCVARWAFSVELPQQERLQETAVKLRDSIYRRDRSLVNSLLISDQNWYLDIANKLPLHENKSCALHFAASYGALEIVRDLICFHGACPRKPNSVKTQTPYWYACNPLTHHLEWQEDKNRVAKWLERVLQTHKCPFCEP